MMQNVWIVGAFAGATASGLLISATLVPPLAILFTFFSPLPLMLAGLSSGFVSAAVGGAIGTVMSGLVGGSGMAGTFLGIAAAPSIVLVYLALLSRDLTVPGGPQRIEWYPAGRLFAAIVFMAAALVAIVTLQIGDDGSELAQSLEQNLLAALGGEEGIQAVLDGTGTDVTPKQYVNLLIQAAPVGIGILFVAVIAINAGIAQRLLALRGMALRPSPSVKDMELPFAHDAAFVGAIVLSLFPGTIGLVGTTLTALFLMSYFLLGLVVVHVMSSRWPSRGLVLFAFYLCLLVLSGLALFVAILGLADAAFGLRRRQTSPST